MSHLTPTSFGELFTINAVDYYRNIVPTTPLNSSHPFCKFWQEFLAKLSGSSCDSFWDAAMRVYTGQPGLAGNRKEMERFKAIFLRNPPNIAIADMQSRTLFGRHKRLPRLWGFIFISQFFVDEWVAAGDGISAIAYEALLKAIIVHETAHWAQSLRVGLFPARLTQAQFDHLPPTELLNLKKKLTPKRFRTFASGPAGESGYYVELAIFGGIITFEDSTLWITTLTDINDMDSKFKTGVPIDALKELKKVGLCRLVPDAPAAPLWPPAIFFPWVPPNRNRRTACDSGKDSDDEDSDDEDSGEGSLPKHCPREFPMLDVLAKISFKD